MPKFLTILIIALFLEAIGVVYLSAGLKQIGEVKTISVSAIAGLIKQGATNGNILVGIFFETIFFGALLYLLSQKDVSLIWPLTALGFVITSVAAKIRLHEEISSLRWAGIALIVCGAGLITWSEKVKERAEAEAKAAAMVQSNEPGLR